MPDCTSVAADRLDLAGDADGVGIGLLLHGKDDAGLTVEAGVAPLGAGGESDISDLAQGNDVALAVGDNEVAQVFDLGREADEIDFEFAAGDGGNQLQIGAGDFEARASCRPNGHCGAFPS